MADQPRRACASSPAIGYGAESSSLLSERRSGRRTLSRSLWTGVAGVSDGIRSGRPPLDSAWR